MENIAYYHCDQLGTPQELTDRNAQLLWSANYKAWGEAQIQQSAAGVAQDVRNQHRYQGQYYDEETGLHYNRFRYYDPHMARYVSRDPIGLQGGSNNSAYVPNSNQWIDPLGLVGYKGPETIYTVGPVIYGEYDLTSQCIDKYEVNLKIKTMAVGFGGKSLMPGSKTFAQVEYRDNNPTIYPQNLNGAWGGAAAAGGKGIQLGGNALGKATPYTGDGKINPNTGKENPGGFISTGDSTTNLSIGASLGRVISFKETWKYCGISEKPVSGPGGFFDNKRTPAAPGFSPANLNIPTVKEPHPGFRDQEVPTNFSITNISF